MSTSIRRGALAICVAGALAASSIVPSQAAGVPMTAAGVTRAVSGDAISVHWRGRHYGRHYGGAAIVGGLAAGLALGAIASSRPYYYDPGYAYAPPPPVYYAPAPAYGEPEAYAAPPPPRGGAPRQCWVQSDDRGFGHWQPC